jgi:hypothetical protein
MKTYTDQAIKFMTDTGTKMTTEFLDHKRYFDDDKEMRDVYKVTLRRNGKSFTFTFGQSIAESGQSEPTAYDVLACLTKSDPGTFENFCGEFGYDLDSMKAHKTYKAVVREYKGVERLFNDVLSQLQEVA